MGVRGMDRDGGRERSRERNERREQDHTSTNQSCVFKPHLKFEFECVCG